MLLLRLLLPALASHSPAPSSVPFFFISLNTSQTGALRTKKMLAAFSGITKHLEHVPGVDGNASARDYTHADAQYNHLLKRNSMSEIGCSMSHVQAIRRAEAYWIEIALHECSEMSTHDFADPTTSFADPTTLQTPDTHCVVNFKFEYEFV